jgi:hypothetical protein
VASPVAANAGLGDAQRITVYAHCMIPFRCYGKFLEDVAQPASRAGYRFCRRASGMHRQPFVKAAPTKGQRCRARPTTAWVKWPIFLVGAA